MALKRGQKRIITAGGKRQVRTYRTLVGSHSLNHRLYSEGYVYDAHQHGWKLAIRKGWNAVLSSKETAATLGKIKRYSGIEEHIRESVFRSVDRVSRGLSNRLPVAYDDDNDLWVVNDYTSRKSSKSIPIEIKLKEHNGKFNVVSFQFRGDESSKSGLQSSLNERLGAAREFESFDAFNARSVKALTPIQIKRVNGIAARFDKNLTVKRIHQLVRSESRAMGVKKPSVKLVGKKDLGRFPKGFRDRGLAAITTNGKRILYINVDNVIAESLNTRMNPTKVIERGVRHELLHRYVGNRGVRNRDGIGKLLKAGYRRKDAAREELVRELEQQSYGELA